MESVNKESMQVFLDAFASTLTGEQRVMLVMDQAGWHKGLVVPKNLELIFLPPYSPELNPVERLWKYIKDAILKNRIYDTIGDLEIELSKFVSSISNETIKSVCNCSYV